MLWGTLPQSNQFLLSPTLIEAPILLVLENMPHICSHSSIKDVSPVPLYWPGFLKNHSPPSLSMCDTTLTSGLCLGPKATSALFFFFTTKVNFRTHTKDITQKNKKKTQKAKKYACTTVCQAVIDAKTTNGVARCLPSSQTQEQVKESCQWGNPSRYSHQQTRHAHNGAQKEKS